MKPTIRTQLVERLVQLYIDNHPQLFGHDVPGMRDIRATAIEDFKRLGLPSRKDEPYRYADLNPCLSRDYATIFTPSPLDTPPSCIFQCDVPQLHAYAIFLINGFYFTDAGEQLTTLPSGVIYGSLKQALSTHPQLVLQHIYQQAGNPPDGLVALATALALDGVFIYIPQGVQLERPIQLISLLQGDQSRMVNTHNITILEPNAQAQIVLCDDTLSDAHFLVNTNWELTIREQANLDLLAMQNHHNNATSFMHLFADIHDGATFTSNTLTIHGGFVRNGIYARLDGENIDAQINGLALVDGQQYVDMHTVVDHLKPSCQSRQLYKTIIDDKGEATFYGIINVHPDAQKTQAYQRNANMLLTDTAVINTRPQLIIHADDVKCSHGATTGQLDEEARFYMQQRGIPAKEVSRLLMRAFVQDLFDTIHIEPLRLRIENIVERRLSGNRSRCYEGDMPLTE